MFVSEKKKRRGSTYKATRLFTILLVGIMCFSAFSLPVAASEPNPTPTPGYEYNDGLTAVEEQMLSYYVWLCMRAWGIEISYQESLEFTDEVSNQINTWIFEYLDSLPSIYTISTWIAPWQSSFDYWGNLRLNDSALDDIQDFVDWLVSKFSMNNNEQILINPTYSVNGAYLYQIGNAYRLQYLDGTDHNTYFAVEYDDLSNPSNTAYPLGYILILVTNSSGNYWPEIRFIGYDAGNYYFSSKVYDYSSNPAISGGGVATITNGPSSHNVYYSGNHMLGGINTGYGTPNPLVLTGNNPIVDYSDLSTYLANIEIVQSGSTKFVVSTLNLPYQDPNYSNGDSITIINGSPQYQIIEWSGEVTVSNLPAVVSTGTIPVPGDENNPGLISVFRPISSLITATADGVAVMLGIIYEFPEEVIIPIFAILGGMILFGIIHAMKEH